VLTVMPPDGGPACHAASPRLDQAPWQVTLLQAKRELPRQLDLALVVDTTGSMGGPSSTTSKSNSTTSPPRSTNDFRTSISASALYLVPATRGDEYVTRSFDFTRSLSDFPPHACRAVGRRRRRLSRSDALGPRTKRSTFMARRRGRLALFSSSPTLLRTSQFAQRTLDAARKLRRAGVTVFPVASSGVREEAEFMMRRHRIPDAGPVSVPDRPFRRRQLPCHAARVELLGRKTRSIDDPDDRGKNSAAKGGLPRDVIAVKGAGSSPRCRSGGGLAVVASVTTACRRRGL